MSRRRRKNPSLRDVNSFVTIGLIVGGGYLFYKYVWPMLQNLGKAPAAVANAVQNVGSSVGGGLYNFLNPNAAGSPITYTAFAPDLGTYIAVNSLDVNSDGTFTYSNGQTYQLQINPSITSGINKVATLIS